MEKEQQQHGADDHEAHLKAQGYDPDILRMER